jgi:quercetin dioxygenase-like cupin family protein
MLTKHSQNREWTSTDYKGIERSLLRTNDTGGRTSLVRLAAGAVFPAHMHHGHEEVLVISGRVNIGGTELKTGDYLFTEPGEVHNVVAVEDSVIYVASQKATPVI